MSNLFLIPLGAALLGAAAAYGSRALRGALEAEDSAAPGDAPGANPDKAPAPPRPAPRAPAPGAPSRPKASTPAEFARAAAAAQQAARKAVEPLRAAQKAPQQSSMLDDVFHSFGAASPEDLVRALEAAQKAGSPSATAKSAAPHKGPAKIASAQGSVSGVQRGGRK